MVEYISLVIVKVEGGGRKEREREGVFHLLVYYQIGCSGQS